jgi:hypothetical protein
VAENGTAPADIANSSTARYKIAQSKRHRSHLSHPATSSPLWLFVLFFFFEILICRALKTRLEQLFLSAFFAVFLARWLAALNSHQLSLGQCVFKCFSDSRCVGLMDHLHIAVGRAEAKQRARQCTAGWRRVRSRLPAGEASFIPVADQFGLLPRSAVSFCSLVGLCHASRRKRRQRNSLLNIRAWRAARTPASAWHPRSWWPARAASEADAGKGRKNAQTNGAKDKTQTRKTEETGANSSQQQEMTSRASM